MGLNFGLMYYLKNSDEWIWRILSVGTNYLSKESKEGKPIKRIPARFKLELK